MAEAGVQDTSTDKEEVVELSKDQRLARPGEPVCVVCGKYGAYICDATDQDVCSLQCKRAHLYSVQLMSSEEATDKQDILATPLDDRILFEHLISDEKLLANVQTTCCSNSPSPLQVQVISAIRSGTDVKVHASTSMDRSLSYLIAAVEAIQMNSYPQEDNERSCPNLLIIAPSRHCCAQVEEMTKLLISGLPNMRTALIVGGAPVANQIYRLKSGIQIVIATVERLLDILVDHGDCVDFSMLSMLVVDELDVLLGAGIQDQLLNIVRVLSEDRQNVVVYTSSSGVVATLANRITANQTLTISHGDPGELEAKSNQTSHVVLWVEEGAKRNKLLSLLCNDEFYCPPLVVYVNSKMGSVLLAEAIHKQLAMPVLSLHGDMSAQKRDAVVKDFTGGTIKVLVTSIMLTLLRDSLQCQEVIIFDLPQSMNSFNELASLVVPSHHSQVVSFVNKSNHPLFAQLVLFMRSLPGVKLPPQLLSVPILARNDKRQHSSSYHSNRKRQKGSIDLTKQNSLVSFIKKSRV